MQIIELPSHKFFIGAQFHPEFKSRPGKPSPLFLGNATRKNKKKDHDISFVLISTLLLITLILLSENGKVLHLNQQCISADRSDSSGIWTTRTFAPTQLQQSAKDTCEQR